MVLLAVGSFSLCGFPSVQFLPYQAFAEGKMMTGACHRLSPASDRPKTLIFCCLSLF